MLNLKILEDVKNVFGEKTNVVVSFADGVVECKLDPEVLADKYFSDNIAVNSLIKDFKYVEVILYDNVSADIQFYLDKDKGFWFNEILDGQLEDFYYNYEHVVDDVIDLVQYVEGLKEDGNTEPLNVFLFNLNAELADLRNDFEEKLEEDIRELVFVEGEEE